MKNDQYFKHDAGASGNQKIMRLIDELGMKGYGAYWLLQETLRMQRGYRAPLSIVRRLARRARVMPAFLLRVIEQYGLFVVEADGFYSPGMIRRMRAYDAKTTPSLHEEAPLEDLNSLNDNGKQLPNARVRREEKKKEEEEGEGGGEGGLSCCAGRFANGVEHWERYIDEAFSEGTWLEVVAMHSGMGKVFLDRLEAIKGLFKLHVRTYGKEPTVCSVADAKSYFGNFVRRGTPTLKTLQEALAQQDAQRQGEDVYRYEQRHPLTGERTYCGGKLIPPDAPPRPDAFAVWDEGRHCWGR